MSKVALLKVAIVADAGQGHGKAGCIYAVSPSLDGLDQVKNGHRSEFGFIRTTLETHNYTAQCCRLGHD